MLDVNTCILLNVMTLTRREVNETEMGSIKDSKALTVRIPTDLWKSVKIKCVHEDTNIQALLAHYLNVWVEDKN
jgi:hypothetical protein